MESPKFVGALLFLAGLVSLTVTTHAGTAPLKSAATTKKDSRAKMAFDSQVVEGEVYRPDYSVVTGESPGEGWGILRLRDNFQDHRATDAEEKRR